MRQIIVPIDFTNTSAAALRFAGYLSRVTGLRVHAVYSYNPMVVSNRPETPEEREEEKCLLQRELDDYVSKHLPPSADLPPVQPTVAEGIAALTIRGISQDKQTALIVMGSVNSPAAGQDDFFGNLARTLAQEGGCPMLFIPQEYGNRILHDTATVLHQLRDSLSYPSVNPKSEAA